jgi:hypothetical protein
MELLKGFWTATHEMGHSWFQHVLASNESKHPWMDEGFTTYVSDLAENEFSDKKVANPFEGNYKAYYSLVNSGKSNLQTMGIVMMKTDSISSYVKEVCFCLVLLDRKG